MKYYIAGPMLRKPHYNFPAFDAARDMLLREGHEVVNPADMDRTIGVDANIMPEDTDWSAIPAGMDKDATIRNDIAALLGCDAIYMLKDWAMNDGSTAEFAVARWAGKVIRCE